MKRREFVKTVAATGAGLSVLPGILGRNRGSLCAQEPAAPQPRVEETTLRQAAGQRMLIGAAFGTRQLARPELATLIADQFNCVTAENEMKPISLQRVQGAFTFEQADRIVNFARDHNMQMIGHNLCWHS